jgi:hypothetical protein
MNLVRNIQQASLLVSIISASFLVCNHPARTEQKACVVTDEGVTVCGKSPSTKPPKNNRPPISNHQVKIDSITFSLKGCKRPPKFASTTVKCTVEIANRGKEDKEIKSFAIKSYMIDASGTSYPATLVDMGGTTSNLINSVSVAPGIDSVVSLYIDYVPKQITQAKVLEFHTDDLDGKVQFGNVPISK